LGRIFTCRSSIAYLTVIITFSFSRWKAGVMSLLRFAQCSPSKVDTPCCRIFTRGFSGGLTKSPFLSVNISLINSGSAITSLGLVSIQPRETFPKTTFNSLMNQFLLFRKTKQKQMICMHEFAPRERERERERKLACFEYHIFETFHERMVGHVVRSCGLGSSSVWTMLQWWTSSSRSCHHAKACKKCL
jgi:hypothetical protein